MITDVPAIAVRQGVRADVLRQQAAAWVFVSYASPPGGLGPANGVHSLAIDAFSKQANEPVESDGEGREGRLLPRQMADIGWEDAQRLGLLSCGPPEPGMCVLYAPEHVRGMFRLGVDHDVLIGKRHACRRPHQTLAFSSAQKLQEAGHALSVRDFLEPPGTAHNQKEHAAGPARCPSK